MIIKKFIAPTMPEALAKVKKELGEEAVILKTRMNRKGGPDNSKSVEVTAAIERETQKRFEMPQAEPVADNASTGFDTQEIRESKPAGVLPSEKLDNLINEIISLKRSYADMAEKTEPRTFLGNFTSPILEVGRELVARNLSEELAFRVIARVAQAEQAISLNRDEIKSRVQKTLAAMIPDGEPIEMRPAGPTVVMFVGLTGSGKTSAVARVATYFKVNEDQKVAIITTDNFRADSSQQVKSFCRILGCPCGIVYTPEELSMAVKSQSEGLILVDTPGINPNDSKELAELSLLVKAAKLQEIHLVVAASTPSRDIQRTFAAFDEFGIDKILITKMDETEAPGGVISAVISSGKKLSYVSHSREIPGQFGIARPDTLADAMVIEKPQEEIQQTWEMEAVGIWQ